MERLSPDAVDGEFAQVYLQGLISVCSFLRILTKKGILTI
jgi:hypothetical protein